MKKNNNNENNELPEASEKIEKNLRELNCKIDKVERYSMSSVRNYLTILSIFITVVFIGFAFFGAKNIFDIHSANKKISELTESAEDVHEKFKKESEAIKNEHLEFVKKQKESEERFKYAEKRISLATERATQLGKSIDKTEKQQDRINEMLKKATLKQMFVLYTTSQIGWEQAFDYHPFYQSFPKQENFETLYFTGEFRTSIAGDTAYFRFYTTDKTETLYSDEFKTISPEYNLIECSLDISKLKNGLCEFGLAAKTQERNHAELKNGYVIVYSKLSTDITNKKK